MNYLYLESSMLYLIIEQGIRTTYLERYAIAG